jgi:putative ABC transport system substrate-binding protein
MGMGGPTDRRAFLAGLAAGTCAPGTALAQPAGKIYRIGYFSPRTTIDSAAEAFRKALAQLGYVEGRNLVIEWRFTKGRTDVNAALAGELVRLNLDCLLGIGVAHVAALQKATTTVPIVIGAIDADPVEEGLVASLAATSRGSPAFRITWPASVWSSCRRRCPGCRGWPSWSHRAGPPTPT